MDTNNPSLDIPSFRIGNAVEFSASFFQRWLMKTWTAIGKRSVCASIVLMCAVSFAQDYVSFQAGLEQGAKALVPLQQRELTANEKKILEHVKDRYARGDYGHGLAAKNK